MALFDNIKLMTESLSKTATKIANDIATTSMENEKINNMEREIDTLNVEIDAAYTQIGRRFVEYVIETQEMPGIDVTDVLKNLDPKIERKKELSEEIIKIQRRLKDQKILQEKSKLEEEFRNEKEKLDKALALDVITNEEYNDKINSYKIRLNKFEEIKRIQQQYELGVISKEEEQDKINKIMEI